MDVELFIDVVKQYEFLYDMDNISYKDNDKKNSTWDEIAKTVNLINGAAAKGKWRNLRDSYLKYLKTIKTVTGQAKNKYKKWPHAEQMKFLKPYLATGETHSNVSETQEDEDGEEERDNDDAEEEENTANQQTQNASSSVTPARPKKRDATEEVVKYLNEKRAKKDNVDDVDLFFAVLAKIVKKLPKNKQARLKLQCSNLILQCEIEHEESKTDASSRASPCSSACDVLARP